MTTRDQQASFALHRQSLGFHAAANILCRDVRPWVLWPVQAGSYSKLRHMRSTARRRSSRCNSQGRTRMPMSRALRAFHAATAVRVGWTWAKLPLLKQVTKVANRILACHSAFLILQSECPPQTSAPPKKSVLFFLFNTSEKVRPAGNAPFWESVSCSFRGRSHCWHPKRRKAESSLPNRPIFNALRRSPETGKLLFLAMSRSGSQIFKSRPDPPFSFSFL